MRLSLISNTALVLWFCCLVFATQSAADPAWSEQELAILRMQWIGSLPELPPDPTNKYADNPVAAGLGQKLFYDKRLSANGKVACATCHVPEISFTDGLAKSKGVGEAMRSAPSILGIAYSPWFFWDGRSDSLWSQALGPLESAVEHGGNRSQYAHIVYKDPVYRKQYELLFGALPDLSDAKRFPENAAPVDDEDAAVRWQTMSEADRKAITRVYVNIGKAIAAYERLLMPGASRFDRYVETVLKEGAPETTILSEDELAGLRLFIGKAMCITCHQGPLFTNNSFHNVGAPDLATKRPKYILPIFYLFIDKPVQDTGRYKGVQQVMNSEFNCLNEYSDATKNDCAELRFANTKQKETLGTFKVPTLRNITKTAPYMHEGQFKNLAELLKHYNTAPMAHVGHSELMPLNLKEKQLMQIEAFLHSLSSSPDVADELLRAPEH